jgi:hypothetical protein
MKTAIAVAGVGRQEGALVGAAVRTVRAAGRPRTAWT